MRLRPPALVTVLLALAIAPLAAPAETFVDVTDEAGIGYVQHERNDPGNCLLFGGTFCEPERMSGGAAAGDVDGDGRVDVLVTRLDAPDILFRNLGGGRFEDWTANSGLDAFDLATNGARFGDVDNDGDLDLYVTTIGDTRFYLFINDGTGHFSEEGAARGAAVESTDVHVGYGIAFGDYDRDGWIDIFTAEWRPAILNQTGTSHSRLLRNRGAEAPGFFEDRTAAAGVELHVIDPLLSWAFGPAFVDLDRDGWPELAIAADFGTSKLFWNNGDGTFLEATADAGVGSDENGMGSTFGDIDGDGRVDWFVTSIFDPDEICEVRECGWGYTGNRLYRNEGGRVFSDATDDAGVRDGAWGWGTSLFDSDNDGDLDLVMTNGVDFPDDEIPEVDEPWNDDAMRFWRNDGGGAMTEMADTVGLTDTGSGKALLSLDYDDDGDLDLLVVNNETGARLFRNDGGNDKDWLRVKLRGRQSNHQGLGAQISIQERPGGPWQHREMGVGSHFLGQSEVVAHFGLGVEPTRIWQLRIRWPSGVDQRFAFVRRNQTIVVTERRTCGVSFEILGLVLWPYLRRRNLARIPYPDSRWRRPSPDAESQPRSRATDSLPISGVDAEFRPEVHRGKC